MNARRGTGRAGTLPMVAIIGASGELGQGLSIRLADAGVPLILASRSPATAQEVVDEVTELFPGANVRDGDYSAAAADADILFLCVPADDTTAVIRSIAAHLHPGQIIAACAAATCSVHDADIAAAASADPDLLHIAESLEMKGVTLVTIVPTLTGVRLARPHLTAEHAIYVRAHRTAVPDAVLALLNAIPGMHATPVACVSPVDDTPFDRDAMQALVGVMAWMGHGIWPPAMIAEQLDTTDDPQFYRCLAQAFRNGIIVWAESGYQLTDAGRALAS